MDDDDDLFDLPEDGISHVRSVLRMFADKEVTTSAAMRAVVAHDDWYVPIVYAARVLGHDKADVAVFGERTALPPHDLWIFSELATATTAYQQGNKLGVYGRSITGRELFATLGPALRMVIVNEGSEVRDKLYLGGPSFGNAAVWADVETLERSLRPGAATQAELIAQIRRYDSYFVALNRSDGSIVTWQNNPVGLRNPGLVFTAPDCLESFLARLPATDGIETGSTTGERLLEMLHGLGIDGLIINPFGPGFQRVLTIEDLSAHP